MSDFGAVYDYALQLEAEIPPVTLQKMSKDGIRPAMMPALPEPDAATSTTSTSAPPKK